MMGKTPDMDECYKCNEILNETQNNLGMSLILVRLKSKTHVQQILMVKPVMAVTKL
jgi:hypothetical protein